MCVCAGNLCTGTSSSFSKIFICVCVCVSLSSRFLVFVPATVGVVVHMFIVATSCDNKKTNYNRKESFSEERERAKV